jgi:hypothetical protein
MRVWGERAVQHFRQRHLEMRARRAEALEAPILLPAIPPPAKKA